MNILILSTVLELSGPKRARHEDPRCLGHREVQGRETASGTVKLREEFVARLG